MIAMNSLTSRTNSPGSTKPSTNASRSSFSNSRPEIHADPRDETDVEAHPEHRKYVFPERPQDAARDVDEQDSTPGLYDKNGRLKHPERSLYYDPVFNPYGAPPPGMPYREKRTSAPGFCRRR